MITAESFTRVDNDSNGNPRYVLHYLALADNYNEALYIAKKLYGGKKFHNKQYGGGIAFQTYNLDDLITKLNNLK